MNCTFENEQAIINKVRTMNFENKPTDQTHQIDCTCGVSFVMQTCLVACPKCQVVYAVTPCHSADKDSIVKGM